ncbi:UPF0481 protein At3g47200 isoform X1 [Coffea arabica]|uniref:UPF0481 protein At3g47200-like isoform X1 n=1 Tax=Coffea arabica TaxID=13443 RepID=A0A6P6WW12_COFAR|nr:UPF0481 protein At3g47200-like isoform X1 [Coffea arabica]XP_027119576.1 UPF0481 protein At3g47200-like isoform X1 [Coffea arabica]
MEAEEKVVIVVDPGSEVKISVNTSKPIPPGQVELPRYTHYSASAIHLASLINDKLSMLASDPLNYGTVCIYRVPEKLRRKNEEAYTPRLVSIGPLHHGDAQLKAMEEYKFKYLNNFLHTFKIPLELLAEYAHSQEKNVCGCYEDTYIRDLSKLSEVILFDGIFIIELFLKNYFPEMREMGDTIFENRWVSSDIVHDLLLLENQLPMRFIATMYNGFVSRKLSKFLDNETDEPPSFDKLAFEYLKNVGNTRKLEPSTTHSFPRARHLVEFLAVLHRPSHPRAEPEEGKKVEFGKCATATKLRAAGVKFSHGAEKCLFDVRFEKGELVIPQLTVNDFTETFYRNLIAFEQCGYNSKDITSYVILMDNLIDTPKDVDLLIEHKIIVNELGSSEQVADVFNNLYKEIVTDPKEFYFANLCNQLNEYSRDWLHKLVTKLTEWIASLRRDYFQSPWAIISFIAACILLVLTVIQTACSILQV